MRSLDHFYQSSNLPGELAGAPFSLCYMGILVYDTDTSRKKGPSAEMVCSNRTTCGLGCCLQTDWWIYYSGVSSQSDYPEKTLAGSCCTRHGYGARYSQLCFHYASRIWLDV